MQDTVFKSTAAGTRRFFARCGKSLTACAALLTIALYGFLFSPNYRIDSIVKLVERGDEFNDLELGRFGIVWLNRLLGMRNYNPYLVALLTLITLLVSAAFLCRMLWQAAGERAGIGICLLPLLIYLTPNWAEQLYFSYQSFLIMLGVALLEIAVCLAQYGKGRLSFAIAALLSLIAFSVYQAFVPLYVCLSVGIVLLECAAAEDVKILGIGRKALRHASVCALALAAYFVIDKLAQRGLPGTAYLSSQIRWGNEPLPGLFASIVKAVWSLVTAKGTLDTYAYLLSAAVCVLMLILFCVKKREGSRAALLCLGWLCLQISAFAMILALGNRTTIRSELGLPLVTALNFLLARLLTAALGPGLRRGCAWLIAAAACLALALNAGLSLRLIYTDDICCKRDEEMALRIVDRLAPLHPEQSGKTVVFIGEPEMKLNAACVEGEAIGYSLFRYHVSLESTNTILSQLMSLHGLDYRPIEPEDMLEATALAKTMPSFPDAGFLAEAERCIVVKMSDDFYFDEEILEPGYALSDKTPNFRDDTVCRLEEIKTDGMQLRLRGHNLLRGTDSRQIVNKLYLHDLNTGALYEVNTACRQQRLVGRQYASDGVSHDACGFTAKCPLEVFERNPADTFEILVGFTLDGEESFVHTGSYMSKRELDRIPQSEIEEAFNKYVLS